MVPEAYSIEEKKKIIIISDHAALLNNVTSWGKKAKTQYKNEQTHLGTASQKLTKALNAGL
jgi:hypothetical protein